MVVIGAMKCGTSALHGYLGNHPQVSMSTPKELNFFLDGGPATGWLRGNWHRGVGWYARQFDPAADLRGESSPGYTSPAHPEVAERMAAVIPRARLIFLVRDPITRAVSQYRHHRREGTERRPPAEALLDPGSQYISRGRYAERLGPFLDRFPLEQIAVVVQEDLASRPQRTLARLGCWLGIDADHWSGDLLWRSAADDDGGGRSSAGTRTDPDDGRDPVELPRWVNQRLADAFRDDTLRLRALIGLRLPHWQV